MIKLKNSAEKIEAYFVNDIPCRVKLDANEGSNYLLKDGICFDDLKANLYPDSDSKQLREHLAMYYNCRAENIMVGNGSSELINMVINAYCDKGDKVLSFVPSFSMYQTYCDLCGAEYVGIQSNDDFSWDINKLIQKSKQTDPKIVILCNPNNPTGYITPREDVIKLLDSVKNSMVIIDEAYADFFENSVLDLINSYENLIVMRTLSKAFGLAGLRVGSLIANEELVKYVWKVKVPYNLNILSQYAALKALNNIERVRSYINNVKKLRSELSQELKTLNFNVYESGANFIFVEPPVGELFEKLMSRGILIRKISFAGKTYNRITVGTEEENKILMDEIKKIVEG